MIIPVWGGWYYLTISGLAALVNRDKPPAALAGLILAILGWAYLLTVHYQ